mmetsp:Transcript_31057/g.77271  ORF Transcript_31057/g.77271 Transcript_31057/m.77271 type:complete len:272 (+) Transcript_31057:149-964(+)
MGSDPRYTSKSAWASSLDLSCRIALSCLVSASTPTSNPTTTTDSTRPLMSIMSSPPPAHHCINTCVPVVRYCFVNIVFSCSHSSIAAASAASAASAYSATVDMTFPLASSFIVETMLAAISLMRGATASSSAAQNICPSTSLTICTSSALSNAPSSSDLPAATSARHLAASAYIATLYTFFSAFSCTPAPMHTRVVPPSVLGKDTFVIGSATSAFTPAPPGTEHLMMLRRPVLEARRRVVLEPTTAAAGILHIAADCMVKCMRVRGRGRAS